MDTKKIIDKVKTKLATSKLIEEARKTNDPKKLEKLSDNKDFLVRYEVAQNKNTSPNTLTEMCSTEDNDRVLEAILWNNKTDADCLKLFIDLQIDFLTYSTAVLKRFLNHPNTDVGLKKDLLRAAEKYHKKQKPFSNKQDRIELAIKEIEEKLR